MFGPRLLAGLAALLSIFDVIRASPLSAQDILNAQNEPCLRAANAAADYTRTHGSARPPRISARLAHDCLRSIPFHSKNATELVESLKAHIEFHSTLDALRDPPPGYLHDAVDLTAQLDAVTSKIVAGRYPSEYDFQTDLFVALLMARDGHLSFTGDVMSLFAFGRPGLFLASVSADGKSLPQVYHLFDTISTNNQSLTPKNLAEASPVIEINGIDAIDFIKAQSYASQFQDPDAAWNDQFFSVRKGGYASGTFTSPTLYPGESTTLRYANGSTWAITNQALVNADLADITNGQDMYVRFCTGQYISPGPNILVQAQSGAYKNIEKDLPSERVLAHYPKPVVSDLTGAISGYFLEDPERNDVAVLAVYSFMPLSGAVDDGWVDHFQATVEEFLAASQRAGKTKLVLDLQGNDGGIVDLALDLFMQIFPKSNGPITKSNLRASTGMEMVMQAASLGADAAHFQASPAEYAAMVPFGYQTMMTTDMRNFEDFWNFYGPYNTSQGLFTSYMQPNWTNDLPKDFGVPGITITGTNDRLNFTQYFDANDIVILSDGACASACAVLVELLKTNHNVKSFTLGGRPQTGPMQTVGGVKGAQLFSSQTVDQMVDLITETPNLGLADENVQISLNKIPILRSNNRFSINGRNLYRMGDESETILQFVYEASDCRMFFDASMIANPIAIWKKVAKAGFSQDGQIDEDICVRKSTRHPTSVSGGAIRGAIGPQHPPPGAQAAKGWLVNGDKTVRGSGVGAFTS